MSTNLDRIETWALSLGDPDDECAMEQEGVMCWHREDDREHAIGVLALIEIAHAARAVTEHHFDTCDLVLGLSAAYPCSCGIDSLRTALSRLDSQKVAK